jgi:hypothetical protein
MWWLRFAGAEHISMQQRRSLSVHACDMHVEQNTSLCMCQQKPLPGSLQAQSHATPEQLLCAISSSNSRRLLLQLLYSDGFERHLPRTGQDSSYMCRIMEHMHGAYLPHACKCLNLCAEKEWIVLTKDSNSA